MEQQWVGTNHVTFIIFVIGGVFQLFFTPFWLKLTTVIAFFIFGVALLYMGITDHEEEADFEHKMHEIEIEMMSDEGRELNRSNVSYIEDPEKVALRSSQNEEVEEESYKIVESKKESVFTKIYKVLAFNQAMKIILTIFVTEMGDRSQISAIGLAAQYPFWIVALAGSIGHILALALAILFGRAISDYSSEKCINIIGGIMFLIFSGYSIVIYYILEEDPELL